MSSEVYGAPKNSNPSLMNDGDFASSYTVGHAHPTGNQSDEVENANYEGRESGKNTAFTLYLATPGNPQLSQNSHATSSNALSSDERSMQNDAEISEKTFQNSEESFETWSNTLGGLVEALGDPAIEKALKDLMRGIPNKNSDDALGIKSYLTLIGQAVQYLQRMTSSTIASDAEMSKTMAQLHLESVVQFKHKVGKVLENMKKARELRKAMEIIGPILIAVTFIVSAVMIAGTFGAASPLAIGLSMFVLGAVTGLMIADTCTQFISKPLGDAISSFMRTLQAAGMSEEFAAVLLVAIMFILIVAMVASGQHAAGAKAAQAAATSAVSAGVDVSTALMISTGVSAATQIMMTALAASGAIAKIVSSICEACGMERDEAAIIGMIVQAVAIMVIAYGIAKANAKLTQNIRQSDVQASKASKESSFQSTIIGKKFSQKAHDVLREARIKIANFEQRFLTNKDGVNITPAELKAKMMNRAAVAAAIGQGSGAVSQIVIQMMNANLLLEKGEIEASMKVMQGVLWKALGVTKEQLQTDMNNLYREMMNAGKLYLDTIKTQSDIITKLTRVVAG